MASFIRALTCGPNPPTDAYLGNFLHFGGASGKTRLLYLDSTEPGLRTSGALSWETKVINIHLGDHFAVLSASSTSFYFQDPRRISILFWCLRWVSERVGFFVGCSFSCNLCSNWSRRLACWFFPPEATLSTPLLWLCYLQDLFQMAYMKNKQVES
jgi:hypothetical protein